MAQFSGPYAVVAGLLGGGGLEVGLDDFSDELAQDSRRRQLMKLVSVVADDRCTAIFPHQFPSVLRVRLRNGEELVEEVMANRGGPQRPLSYDELATKFEDNAARMLAPDAVALVKTLAARLEELEDVAQLLAPLADLMLQSPRLNIPSTN